MTEPVIPSQPKGEKTEKTSKFRIFSMGLVAINKPLRTYTIEVVPIEYNPFHSGEATDNIDIYKAQNEGGDGADPVDLALKTTPSLRAEWMPLGCTNRITAPDVRRGDEVLIFQFADAEAYFWVLWRRKGPVTRLETVTFELSNERKENVPLTPDNTYLFHLSTHEKLIHIQTSKSDGEPHAWWIQLNTKDSTFTVRDDIGNEVNIDSKEHLVQLKNADGCKFELNKRVINALGVDEINLNTKRFKVDASESATINTRDFTQTARGYKSSATKFQFNGPGVFSGSFEVGGDLLVKGKSNHIGQSTGPGHR